MERVLRIPVHYDFASSLCYVAHRVMQRMAGELEALQIELEWTPVDLTRIAVWRRGDAIEGIRRDNALRVARELDVPVRMPSRWMDSRPAMAAALALDGTGREATWRERVWTAVYEEGRMLDEPGELERLGRELELDVAPLVDPPHVEALEVRTLCALEAEVTGVPTFVLNGWPLGGIQAEATMRSILERFAARKRRGLC
jgi:predicted DsbA family dithiol-disulfide isomerase